MAFWTYQKLAARLRPETKGGEGVITPFNDEQIDCASYELTLGDEAFVTSDTDDWLRSAQSIRPGRLGEGQCVVVPSGQFAYLITNEAVRIPKDTIGFISIKTGFKFKGLVNVSGFHVDPGYAGRLVFGVYNAGPNHIHVRKGERVFLLFLADLNDEDHKGVDSHEHKTKEGYPSIPTDLMSSMSGPVKSLHALENQLERIDATVKRHTLYVLAGSAVLGWLVSQIVR